MVAPPAGAATVAEESIGLVAGGPAVTVTATGKDAGSLARFEIRLGRGRVSTIRAIRKATIQKDVPIELRASAKATPSEDYLLVGRDARGRILLKAPFAVVSKASTLAPRRGEVPGRKPRTVPRPDAAVPRASGSEPKGGPDPKVAPSRLGAGEKLESARLRRPVAPGEFEPRIREVYVEPGAVQFQNTTLGLGLEGLPAGSRVRALDETPGPIVPNRCRFHPREGVSYSLLEVDGQGRLVYTAIQGWFGRESLGRASVVNAASCGATVHLDVVTPDGETHRKIVHYPNFRLPQEEREPGIRLRRRRSRRVEDTWSWQDRLQFDDRSAVGACDGVARGLGVSPDFEVGVLEHDGDISFRIRTGPIGTRCRFVSVPAVLPNGTLLRDIGVRVENEGTAGCHLEEETRFTRGATDLDTLEQISTASDPVMTQDQVILAQNDRRRLLTVLLPVQLVLVCDATLRPNEGGIRVTLTHLATSGP